VKSLTDRVWMRSHEEEKGGVRVYRPDDYPFPPARGREGLSFHADGQLDYLVPGRGDRPTSEPGTWRADPVDPARLTAQVAGQTIGMRVAAVDDDILRLTWTS
jgi:hypothetical protein